MDKRFDRNFHIDILRTIGTLFVILAHVSIPQPLAIFRSFDVCLLVMVSGYCCHCSDVDYWAYLKKRIRRLCVPAWFAATLIFLICIGLCLIDSQPFIYSFREVIETYLFIGGKSGGIGLFWIVRIYLLVAIAAPILVRVNELLKAQWLFIGGCIAVLGINEVLYNIAWSKSPELDFILENYVMSLIAYSVVYAIGLRLKDYKEKLIYPMLIVTSGLLVIAMVNVVRKNGGYVVSDYKYPPRLVYILFGVALSLALWLLVSKLDCKNTAIQKYITWFSRNSFTIYLCHAVVLKLLSWGNRLYRDIQLMQNWAFFYFVVVCSSVLITYLFNKGKVAMISSKSKEV